MNVEWQGFGKLLIFFGLALVEPSSDRPQLAVES
jgi:hypothetical protein